MILFALLASISISYPLKLKQTQLQPWLQLTRPHNIPASMIFPIAGALSDNTNHFNPSSALETASIVATVTTASVVINSYHDAQLYNDDPKNNPIASGSISSNHAKTLFSSLYLAALVPTFIVVENTTARLVILFSMATTYFYTEHLKPHVFIKNTAVASVTALAPYLGFITSLEQPPPFTTESTVFGLCLATFFGILSREILMDITDIETDAKTNRVVTIPVLYGVNVALAFSAFSLIVMSCVCFYYSKNVIIGEMGSLAMLYRIFEIYCTDKERCPYAIRESTFTFLLVVASFLNV